MTFLLMLSFLFSSFVQKWYFPQGINGGNTALMQLRDTDRDSNLEFIFTTYGSWPAYIHFYELHLPNTWERDSVPLPGGDLLWDSGDFDSDGLYDLTLQFHIENPSLADGIMVFESPDSFSYPTQEVWRDTVGFAAVVPILAYDVDRDGYPEIFDKNGNGQPHYIWVYESIGDNQYDTVYTFNPMTDTFPQSSISTNAFGDFDGDGYIECAMGDLSAGALGVDYWVFESPANNTYVQIFQGYISTKDIKDCFSVPDADGDGKLEFALKGEIDIPPEVHLFIFEATGDSSYAVIKSFTLFGGDNDYYGGYSDAGDVDGDSIPEIVLEACQNVYIIKAYGNDSFALWETLPGNPGGSNVRVTADIDQNGLNEIVISGNNYTRIYEWEPGKVKETSGLRPASRTRELSVYPNLIYDKFTINYIIPKESMIKLALYDVAGKITTVLVHESQKPGTYRRIMETENLTQGIYFVRLETNEYSLVAKIVILR